MSTLIIAAVLVSLVAAACVLLITINNKQKQKVLNRLLQQFSEAGATHQLRFSGQEVLGNCIIGLDGIHRKLLVVERLEEPVFTSLLIPLSEVKSCAVKKIYATVGGDPGTKSPEQFLQKIVLHFSLHNDKPSLQVMFYNHLHNHVYEVAELEQKAKHWETALAKMLVPERQQAWLTAS